MHALSPYSCSDICILDINLFQLDCKGACSITIGCAPAKLMCCCADDAVNVMQKAHVDGLACVISCSQEDAETYCEGGLRSTTLPTHTLTCVALDRLQCVALCSAHRVAHSSLPCFALFCRLYLHCIF